MAAVDILQNKRQKRGAWSYKQMCKRCYKPLLLFLFCAVSFSYFLSRESTNTHQRFYKKLEELIEDVEYTGKISNEQKKELQEINERASECKASCRYLLSLDADCTTGLSTRQLEARSLDSSSLANAFHLLETYSYFKDKGEKKKALQTQNDLKKTLDHKSFMAHKRKIFTSFLQVTKIEL